MTQKQRERDIETIRFIISDLENQAYYQGRGKIYIEKLNELLKELEENAI